MKIFTLRLKPSQDIRKELLNFAIKNNLEASSVITCVGSLNTVILRMAGALPEKQDIRILKGKYEIVSLVGTLNNFDCHLHIAVSDKSGAVIGGHLKEGSLVDSTAEIVIAENEDENYIRKLDKQTGFLELKISKNSTKK